MMYVPCSVQDRDQIRSHVGGHAVSLGLEDDKGERQEHAPEEEKRSRHRQDEFQFLQWLEELHGVEGLHGVLQSRLDRKVGDDEQAEDHESADTHRPGKTDFLHEMVDHDGEDDSS